MSAPRLNRDFFLRPTLKVARELLGKQMIMRTERGEVIGEINEVEAYVGHDDPACHAAAGRTKRNEVMFWEGGHAYVYFTYGMYHCLNFVTEENGFPAAVLIRSVIPIKGQEIMMKNRGEMVKEINLSNGPGKLCLAFGIDRTHNGTDLVKSEQMFVLDSGRKINSFEKTSRIGISKGKDLLWRFVYG